MSTLKVDEILKRTGTGTITIGQSGDTIDFPTGTTISGSAANAPAFNVFKDSATSVADTTFTQLVFNQENFDTDSAYNTSTGFFTVPTNLGGKYFIYATSGLNNVTPQRCLITIEKNSSTGILVTEFGSGSPYGRATASGVVSLSAGDTLRVLIYQNGGGSSNTLTGQESCCFGGYRIIGE